MLYFQCHGYITGRDQAGRDLPSEAGYSGPAHQKYGGQTIYETLGAETIILKKIDDHTVLLQKSKNGDFIDSGTQLFYCGQDAQRVHAQQKAGK
jgi:hypothetical protein